jgi:hypothetical protein
MTIKISALKSKWLFKNKVKKQVPEIILVIYSFLHSHL